MTDLHTLLAAGAEEGGTAYPPGEHFYERAERKARGRRTRNATLGGVAASLVALGGAGAVGGWLPGLVGPNRGPGPVVPAGTRAWSTCSVGPSRCARPARALPSGTG